MSACFFSACVRLEKKENSQAACWIFFAIFLLVFFEKLHPVEKNGRLNSRHFWAGAKNVSKPSGI